jgi:glycosyltransferase involved in cell wall biosynthesis
LRIAVLSPFVDRSHGTERAVAELVERLATSYGCEIHLYSQRVENLRLDDPRIWRSQAAGAIFWRKVPGIGGPHLVQFLAWMVCNGLLRWWDTLFGRRFDAVLSPGINCLDANVIVVHALFKRFGELLNAESEGAQMQPSPLHRLHRLAYYGLLALLEGRIYRDRRVRLAAVSSRTAEMMSIYFGRKDVKVVPNGVDTHVFCPQGRRDRRCEARQRFGFAPSDAILLLIGNAWRNKGLAVLLQAAARCSDLPMRILVVGKDDTSAWINVISRLHLVERVVFSQPASEVLDFYAAADVYAAPSLEDPFNLPALEAMACGLPVIVSREAGVSEWIHDGEDSLVLQNAQDAEELEGLIRKLVQDPALMQRLGENAARNAAKLTWDGHAAAVWELLKASAADRRGALV